MDGLREFLDTLKQQGLAQGNFVGMLNVLISRRIETPTGTLIANGLTWRALADWLKRVRWERDAVREVGLDPAALPPRDRQRFWYQAIAQAHVDSPEALRKGEEFAERLRAAGLVVGPGPTP